MYKSALIYARFSDPRTDGSLERQVRELEALALSNGIANPEVISEDDVTGWTIGEERKGRWPEVVDGLRSGRWDCLIVRSLDRCARDVVETINLARLAERHGFGFIALNGDKLDKLSAMFRGYASEEESRVKSDRLKLKWADKASQGNYHPGRWRPYGFQYTHNEHGVINGLVVDPVEAEIVREVAGRLCLGESPHSIALELERRDIPTVTSSQWQRMMVVRLVKPVSAGLIAHNGQVMPGNHQAIISDLEYWQVQAALNKGDAQPSGHNTRKHLLAGMVVCNRCGVIMQCNGRVYQCSTKNTRRGVRGCGRVTVRKPHIEALVVGKAMEILKAKDGAIELRVETDWSPVITAAEHEATAIQAAYEAGDITASEWIAGLKVARQKASSARESRLEHFGRLTGQNANKLAGSDAQARWDELNLSQQRATLFELFKAVIVKPGVKGRKLFDEQRIELVRV